MLFQLKSHAYLYEGTPQHVIDEQTQPGILQRMDSTSSSSSSTTSRSTSISTVSTGGGSVSKRRRVKRKIRAKLGRKRQSKTEEEVIQEEEEISSAPLPTYTAPTDEKEKGPQHEMSGAMTSDPAATIALNAAAPVAPTAKRPGPIARGLTIRPPPVFRADPTAQNNNATRSRMPASQVRRFNSTPNMPSSAALRTGTPPRAATDPTKKADRQPSLAPAKTQDEEAPLAMWPALILLIGSTVLVAICAEFMVSSIEHLVESSPLSEAFIGLIILPIVGNAAEHVTAVVVASKNKLDLALGVSLGSSIQIALFITPIVIIIGWGLDKNMSLYFTLFETVSLFVSVFVVCFLCLDGKSNYLEGSLLCAAYIIIAVGAFFFPDSEGQSASTSGPGGS